MSEVKFKRTDNLKVEATGGGRGSIETQSVEALLLLAVLEKLEEIRCGLIDIEDNTRNV